MFLAKKSLESPQTYPHEVSSEDSASTESTVTWLQTPSPHQVRLFLPLTPLSHL